MSNLEEQFITMQQQMQAMQEMLQAIAKQPQPSGSQPMDESPMQSAAGTATLHSLAVRPTYDWTPSTFLVEQLCMDEPLHTSTLMNEEQRKRIIESYPGIAGLDYKAPTTLPIAEKKMSKGQLKEDRSLKQAQYLFSAVFRPLDILANELALAEQDNPNLERYFKMISDIRNLMVHNCSFLTKMRNDIAFRVFNPGFSTNPNQDQTFTMPNDTFQTSLVQQTNAEKALRDANFRRTKHPFSPKPKGQFTFADGDNPRFFRSGPSSKQGGYNNGSNANGNGNGNGNTNRQYNNNNNGQSRYHHHTAQGKGKSTNPFHSNQQ
ncbi:hypothetical protein G6F56_007794 [Rhizopus delemar]|nr:hypothetical protein G6F56_007794 [Rhizopus delemar]